MSQESAVNYVIDCHIMTNASKKMSIDYSLYKEKEKGETVAK